jgi:ribose-phosphate pyrophosphokinase
MIDTGGTLCRAAADLKKRGARKIYCFASHGVFSTGKKALNMIEKSVLT